MAYNDTYDVGKAIAAVENELLDSMMRNLKKHKAWEEKEGFDWSQWQVEQLKYLEEFRRTNENKYGKQFDLINAKIQAAIENARDQGGSEEEIRILQVLKKNKGLKRRLSKGTVKAAGDAFFRINERKLNALIKATMSDMQKAEAAILRRVDDQYRKVIFNAQMYANTGAATYEKAVDMATKDFLRRGIDCVEYKNGARHTLSDYADMALRTAEKRAYLMGEAEKREEWGLHLVIVNQRGTSRSGSGTGGACPKCIPWIGKILIDDVYGSGRSDGKHICLSEAMAAGFLHPRCRDSYTTYFPGVTSVPDPVMKKDVKAAVETERAENRANLVERTAESYERLAQYSLDPENKRKYKAREEEWRSGLSSYESIRKSITIEDFINANASEGSLIQDEVLESISKTLEKYKASRKFESVRIEDLGEQKVFDTVFTRNGFWYDAELVMNSRILGGKSIAKIDEIFKNADNTVCNSLNDAVIHEIYHARIAQLINADKIDVLNKTEGLSGISKTASKDMLESLSEIGVLKERGERDKIMPEQRRIFEKYFEG